MTPPESPAPDLIPPPKPRWLLVRAVLFVALNLVLGHLLFVQGSGIGRSTSTALWLGDWRAGIAALASQLLVASWLVAGIGCQPQTTARHQPGILTALGIVVASLVTLAGYLLLSLMNFLMMGEWQARSFLGQGFLAGMLAVYAHVNGVLGLSTFAAVVGAVWLALGVGGYWRPAHGLLDRVGLGIGGAYLVLGLASRIISPQF